MTQQGVSRGAADLAVYDPADTEAGRLIGRVVARGRAQRAMAGWGARCARHSPKRRQWLIEQDLARAKQDQIVYRANLLGLLRRRELAGAGAQLADELGLPYIEKKSGQRIERIYRRTADLARGRFAVIERSREFMFVHGGLCRNAILASEFQAPPMARIFSGSSDGDGADQQFRGVACKRPPQYFVSPQNSWTGGKWKRRLVILGSALRHGGHFAVARMQTFAQV